MEQLGAAAHHLVAAAQQAFVDGISGSLLIAAGIVAVTSVVVAVLAPSRTTPGAPTVTPADEYDDEKTPVPVP